MTESKPKIAGPWRKMEAGWARYRPGREGSVDVEDLVALVAPRGRYICYGNQPTWPITGTRPTAGEARDEVDATLHAAGWELRSDLASIAALVVTEGPPPIEPGRPFHDFGEMAKGMGQAISRAFGVPPATLASPARVMASPSVSTELASWPLDEETAGPREPLEVQLVVPPGAARPWVRDRLGRWLRTVFREGRPTEGDTVAVLNPDGHWSIWVLRSKGALLQGHPGKGRPSRFAGLSGPALHRALDEAGRADVDQLLREAGWLLDWTDERVREKAALDAIAAWDDLGDP